MWKLHRIICQILFPGNCDMPIISHAPSHSWELRIDMVSNWPRQSVSQEVGSGTRLSLSWWLELRPSNVATLGAISLLCALTDRVQWFSKLVCEPAVVPSSGNWWKTQILRSLCQPSDLASLERSPAMYILTGPPRDSDTHSIGMKRKRDLGNMTDGKERGNFYGWGNLPALNSWYPAMFLSLVLVRYF